MDRIEAEFTRRVTRLMAERAAALEPLVAQVLRLGRLPEQGVVVPGAEEHAAAVKALLVAAFDAGWIGAREDLQVLRNTERQAFATVEAGVDPVVPQDAVEFLRGRVALQGKWNRDLDAAVTQVLVNAVQQGATHQEVMAVLKREVFPAFAQRRLENIARTETTTALSQGRLAMFGQDPNVVAVQFVAVMDKSTTPICRARNGLIMRKDDARLQANTPPLHYMCRSSIWPVRQLQWERLERGDPKAEERMFGWVKPRELGLPRAPRNLEEALAGWDDKQTPPPLPGFGGDLAPKQGAKAAGTPAKEKAPARAAKEKPAEPRAAKEQEPKQKPLRRASEKPGVPKPAEAPQERQEAPQGAEEPAKSEAPGLRLPRAPRTTPGARVPSIPGLEPTPLGTPLRHEAPPKRGVGGEPTPMGSPLQHERPGQAGEQRRSAPADKDRGKPYRLPERRDSDASTPRGNLQERVDAVRGAGVDTIDKVMGLGRVIHEEVAARAQVLGRKIETLETERRQLRAERRKALTQGDITGAERAAEQFRQKGQQLRALRETGHQDAVLETLSEIRPFGNSGKQQWSPDSDIDAVGQIESAGRFVPAAWWEASNTEPLHAELSSKPSYYLPSPKGPNNIAVVTGDTEDTVHELGHHFEEIMPALLRLTHELREKRGRPWPHPMMAQEYARGDRPFRPSEILSLGLQGLYFRDWLWQDEEVRDFILGVLAGV